MSEFTIKQIFIDNWDNFIVRNPELNKYLINKLLKSKNKKFKPKNIDLNLDKKAYTSYLKTYYNSTLGK